MKQVLDRVAPASCEVCKTPIVAEFYDARMKGNGPWGNMCPNCFRQHGVGLGVGKGQHYVLTDGQFVKTEG